MVNSPTVWSSNTGLNDVPKVVKDVVDILPYNKRLLPKEVKNIEVAFANELYDMALEYTWRRTFSIIKDIILKFGDDFVLDMLGKTEKNSVDTISQVEYIRLAADLGIINEIAKKRFLHLIELIDYFSSRETINDMEELRYSDALNNIETCIYYILGYDDDGFNLQFNEFREQLRNSLVDDKLVDLIKISPYFYKKTTVRTLLNLLGETKGGEADNVFSNMVKIIPEIWDNLLSDDKYPLGLSYAESISEGEKFKSGALKTVLIKVKGFDYVPENLRSLSFIEVANKLIEIHYGYNNFYKEPAQAKLLNDLGTVIPGPALSVCIRASLMCIIGTPSGVSNAAQGTLFEILDKLNSDKWQSYFNNSFMGDEAILYKIFGSTDKMLERLKSVIEKYDLLKLTYSHQQINTILESILNNNFVKARSVAKAVYNSSREK